MDKGMTWPRFCTKTLYLHFLLLHFNCFVLYTTSDDFPDTQSHSAASLGWLDDCRLFMCVWRHPWKSVRKSFIVFAAMSSSSRRNPQLSALHAVQQNWRSRFRLDDKKSYLPSLSWLSIYASGKCCAVYSPGTHFDVSWCLCFCISSVAVSARVTS